MATSAFGKAFAEARKSGLKEFEFGGKKYNTKMASDSDASSPKAGVYVPRDFSSRAGERAKSENYVPRDSDTMRGPRATSRGYVGRGGIGGGAGRGGQGGPSATDLLAESAEDERAPTFKSGGMTASKRADGCAQRGKTKGRMV
jgi:hypothetical protein